MIEINGTKDSTKDKDESDDKKPKRIYGVQLSYNNGAEIIQLPVHPASIDVKESGQGNSHDVVRLGEINVIKNRKLTEYSFSGLFPAYKYPFAATEAIARPVDYIKLIEKWMTTRRPIRFIFISDTYDINTPASIESFEWSEVAGGMGDIEYSLKLKKYVFYAARQIPRTANSKVAVETRPNDKQKPRTYKMVKGDSLWKIAKTQLGNANRWKEIQKLNGISDAELKRLQIGRVLKLP